MTSEKKKMDPVRKWTFIVMAVCLVLFVIYLVADRITPFTAQARVHAYVVPVAPQVAGNVVAVDVENNQLVKAGQRLFQIDPSSYQVAVESAEAVLKNTRQTVDSGVSNLDAAQANVDSAKANLWRNEQDTERMRRIRKDDPGAISDRRLQSAEAGLESARAGLAAAQAQLESARNALGSIDENNAQLQQARSSLENARINLERTSVYAPVDGLITDLRVDRGNYAKAGTALMTFIAIHDSWVRADLSENNLGNVDAGDPVEITFDVRPGRVYPGKVRRMGYGVQVSSNALGTLPTIDNQREWLRSEQRFPVMIDFEVPEEIRERLRVGSQASIIVYTGDNWLMNALGRFYIRLTALFSYLY